MTATQYSYDGMGRRISQSVNSIVTQYLLDLQPGLEVVLGATTGSDTVRHMHGLRGIHAQQGGTGAWNWMLQDGLGSVRSVVDSSLNVLESRLYQPYGVEFGGSGTHQTAYSFTGEMRDPIGLQYHRARYLNPALGVFTSLDPLEGVIQRPMSLNRYSWVEGNVPNAVDPSGMIYELPSMWDSCASGNDFMQGKSKGIRSKGRQRGTRTPTPPPTPSPTITATPAATPTIAITPQPTSYGGQNANLQQLGRQIEIQIEENPDSITLGAVNSSLYGDLNIDFGKYDARTFSFETNPSYLLGVWLRSWTLWDDVAAYGSTSSCKTNAIALCMQCSTIELVQDKKYHSYGISMHLRQQDVDSPIEVRFNSVHPNNPYNLVESIDFEETNRNRFDLPAYSYNAFTNISDFLSPSAERIAQVVSILGWTDNTARSLMINFPYESSPTCGETLSVLA